MESKSGGQRQKNGRRKRKDFGIDQKGKRYH